MEYTFSRSIYNSKENEEPFFLCKPAINVYGDFVSWFHRRTTSGKITGFRDERKSEAVVWSSDVALCFEGGRYGRKESHEIQF